MTACEEYIGLMPVAKTNADTIVVCITDVLLHMNLRIQVARVQCYDGCSTMSGTQKNEKCLLTSCCSDSLNLAVTNTKKKIFYC